MKACFADNIQLPSTCCYDSGNTEDCLRASQRLPRGECPYWQPERAVEIARDILGINHGDTKKCFGLPCKGCKDFFLCEEHFPPGCWGDT